ncbi:MAG: Pertactin autotransporter [Stenotrophomonas maltophilia]|uniref:Pertactin autotransporter n=1 Tax=Stenotrophomonas maltophilia TaxID=40324 RepID=A0A7V8JLE6_STEMA|nr:MAG: Pertactin autotransporter [Stenotrophomonas maltophilia]
MTQVPTTPSPLPTGLSSPPTPGARRPRAALVPIYRLETAAYAAVPPVLQGLQQASLGTFHERQGEQRLLVGQGAVQGGWIRMVGQSSEQHWKGDALAGFDGDLLGLQAGADVYASDGDGWHHQAGVLVGRTRATGTVTGLALAWENVQVGQLRLDDRHAGLYWTGVGNAGGYIDVVLLRSRFRGEVWSTRGLGINVRGDGTAASLEAGRPWPLGASGWSLEPQVQVLWQRQSLDDARDAFAALQFDSDTAWSGRIGLRLAADRGLADNGWQPYFKLDYWQAASGEHRVRFDGEPIRSEQRARAWQAGVGVVGRINRTISAYAVADYTADIGGGRDARRRTLEATLGLRADW